MITKQELVKKVQDRIIAELPYTGDWQGWPGAFSLALVAVNICLQELEIQRLENDKKDQTWLG